MLPDLATQEVAAIFAAYLCAAFVKGATGLGFSTTCLPILALLIGLKEALPLVIIPSICSNLVVMRQARRFGETLRRFWPMLLGLLPGLAAGLWALSRFESVQAGAALGCILLMWVAFTVVKPDLRVAPGWQRPLAPLIGCLNGFVNGVTGSQVMPAVPFLMMLKLERDMFVQAVNCVFTLSSIIFAFGLGQLGLFSRHEVIISILGIAMVFVGLRFGATLRERLSERMFRNAILSVLSVMGVSLVSAALI